MLKTPKNIDRFINKVIAIHEQSAADTSEIAFLPRQFITTPLPYRNPPSSCYERHDGCKTFVIEGNKAIGLPYGALARLLLAHMTTEAIQKNSRVIQVGAMLKELLDKLQLTQSGGRNGAATRLKNQLLRFMTMKVSLIEQCRSAGRYFMQGEQLLLIHQFKLTWLQDHFMTESKLPNGGIQLAYDFFESLKKTAVPVNWQALQALRRSPLQMDMYVWLTYRFFTLSEPQLIRWENLKNQFGFDYADNAQGLRDFKKKFLYYLTPVLLVYSAAQIDSKKSKQGIWLFPSPTHIKKQRRKKEKCARKNGG